MAYEVADILHQLYSLPIDILLLISVIIFACLYCCMCVIPHKIKGQNKYIYFFGFVSFLLHKCLTPISFDLGNGRGVDLLTFKLPRISSKQK